MNFVQPIRDPECIFYIKRFLKEQNMRNYMLFVTGINSGLRISDILQLRVRDAKRPYFNLIEKKTKKKKRIDTMTQLFKENLRPMSKGKRIMNFSLKAVKELTSQYPGRWHTRFSGRLLNMLV